MNQIEAGRYVVVFDHHRDIFFGVLVEHDRVLQSAILTECRPVFSYQCRPGGEGSGGLATHGPGSGSKISPPAPKREINDVSSVVECTAEAVKAFGEVSWG